MKTTLSPSWFFKTPRQRLLAAAVSLLSAALTSSASVTVQGWWHLDISQPIADSSGNGRTFGSAYSTAPATGGLVAAQPINNGAGGPLGDTGYISSECVRFGVGVGGQRQSAMWNIGYNPPAQNYGIEIWVLPQNTGVAGGSGGWIFSSGQTGGVAFRINDSGGPSYIDAFDVGNTTTIGSQAPIDTNEWMELALVNNGGVITFYTNGVPCGSSFSGTASTPAGAVYIGSPGDNNAYDGYLDEARMFTFAPGAFTTNDLLLRPRGPNLLDTPGNDIVGDGGAAPFNVVASFDFNSAPGLAQTYQWQEGGVALPGATNSSYTLPVVTPASDGSNFTVVVTKSGISVTSAPPSLLSVVPNNAANTAAYQNLVKGTSGLLAYFPIDGDTSSVVSNVIDSSFNGSLELDANYDGRTNRSFGQRALSFDGNAVVSVPNNSAYEFSSGAGSIEALVYLRAAPGYNATIFSENPDGGPAYYSLSADATGSFLVYANDSVNATTLNPTSLTFAVPGGLVGQLLDIALVIDHTTNVTVYANGQSLGTQSQPSFGDSPGGNFWIGGIGFFNPGSGWLGTIDELSIYSSALSVTEVQAHYTKFVFGTNVVPPVITSQPTGKTVLAGGSPQLTITATGGLPLLYQWTSNSVPIPGATAATLVISNSAVASNVIYAVSVSNVFGVATSQPIVMTFVAPPSGYPSTVMKDHPAAFWRMADTAGPTAVDSAGLNDAVYSGSGVTYAAGGPTFDSAAGVSFDGSSGRAVTPANFPAINPAGPFTIEFWAKLSEYQSVDSTGHLFSPLSSMPRPSRTGGWEWYMGGNSDGYEFHTAEAGGYSLITADNNEPPVGDWWYMTGVWDGTNLYIYVNGQLGNDQIDPPAPAGTDNFATEGLGQTAFVANTSVPLYIGSRSDGVDYFDGAMADIAFYDYALSYAQITNHWSAAWLPATVVTPPGVTNVEDSTITLSPTVTGLPNTYQWFFNGTALNGAAQNSDGTLHYPNGVNSSSLTITQTKPTADSGVYVLAITNTVANAVSGNINVDIVPNTNPPTIVSVTGLATPNTAGGPSGTIPFVVKVVFSGRISPATGSTVANYSLSPSVPISHVTLIGSGPNDLATAALGGDWREALLITSGLTPGQKYTLTVSGLKDQSQTPLSVPTETASFTAPVLTPGVVNWDYYYLGNGNTSDGGVDGLAADVNYQNYAPQTNAYFTALDTDQITAGDLNTVPPFNTGLGEYYGDVTSGWITPTVSGSYTFFLAADDSAVFELSTSSSPAGIAQIATLANATGAYQETNADGGSLPPQDSSPITLTAGHSYYFQLRHEEITGGDYARVAWRISTDSTPASALSAIPGTYLSSYAPPASSAPPEFGTTGFANGTFTLNWASGTLQESTNLVDWIAVPGAPSGSYSVPVNSGTNVLFFRLKE
jgi:hypothetical protein